MKKTDNTWIGYRIRQLRMVGTDGEISQTEVAKALKVKPQLVAQWESGEQRPTPDEVSAIAAFTLRFSHRPKGKSLPDLKAQKIFFSVIGERIRDLRHARAGGSISQFELAQAVGMSSDVIHDLETGKHRATTLELATIASYLGVPIQTLFPSVALDPTAKRFLPKMQPGAMAFYRDLGIRIRYLRESSSDRKKSRLSSLADAIGIPLYVARGWEWGEHQITAQEVSAIAEYFDVPLQALFPSDELENKEVTLPGRPSTREHAFYQELGRRIHFYRNHGHEKALSREELAKRLKITPVTLSEWERGVGRVTAQDVAEIAKILGIPSSLFFADCDQKSGSKETALYLAIGSQIRHHRTTSSKENITQAELAKRLNVPRFKVSEWERGKGQITIQDLATIATILSLPIASFFPGSELYEADMDSREKATYRNLGTLMRHIRTMSGSRPISRTEIAKRLGVKESIVSNWEGGRSRLTVQNVVAFAEAIGVPSFAFFIGIEEQREDSPVKPGRDTLRGRRPQKDGVAQRGKQTSRKDSKARS